MVTYFGTDYGDSIRLREVDILKTLYEMSEDDRKSFTAEDLLKHYLETIRKNRVR